jgi:large subunit ribosomal protein L4
MAKVAVFNQAGEQVKDIELSDAIFGIEPNQQAIFDVVKAQRAAMRQGTHSTKNRAAVRGGGRKPWRQKGTGRARQGSITAPNWVGGGIVFGPTPRKYNLKVNKKVRRLAFKSVLSGKLQDGELKVVDTIQLESIKTKDMVQVLNNLNLEGKVAVVLGEPNDVLALSARNIPGVVVTTANHVSVYELLSVKHVLLTEDAVKHYEEVLA